MPIYAIIQQQKMVFEFKNVLDQNVINLLQILLLTQFIIIVNYFFFESVSDSQHSWKHPRKVGCSCFIYKKEEKVSFFEEQHSNSNN